MLLSLRFRERLASLGQFLVGEFDNLVSQIRAAWDTEHADDGTHSNITASTIKAAPTATTAIPTGRKAVIEAGGEIQTFPKVALTGQEWLAPATTSPDGVGLLLGTNRTANRQIWLADTALLASSATSPMLQLALAGSQAYVDALATDTTTALILNLNSSGGLIKLGKYSYIADDQLNYRYDLNADGTGFINWSGYANSTTRFRDLIIANGKQQTIATFKGSDKSVKTEGTITERSRTTPMGEWIDVAFAAGNFTATGGEAWGLTSGDQILFRYMLIGKTMWIAFVLDTTTVTNVFGGPAQLRFAIPGGFTAAKDSYMTCWGNNAGAGWTNNVNCFTQVGLTVVCMQLPVFGVAVWAIAANTTYVRGVFQLEIQ